jgi:hypothetical protein
MLTENKIYTLVEGIAVCKEIEELIKPLGCHCGLGGSLMYRGYSTKDIDVLIYPRSKAKIDKLAVVHALAKAGYKFNNHSSSVRGSVEFDVEVMKSPKGERVDIFFLQR